MKQGKKNTRIEKGWDKMEFLLDKELPVKNKKKRRFFWLFPTLGLSALAIALWIYYPSNEPEINNASLPFNENVKKENTPKQKASIQKDLVQANTNRTNTPNPISDTNSAEEKTITSENKNIQIESNSANTRIAENNNNYKLKQKEKSTILTQSVSNNIIKEKNTSPQSVDKKEELANLSNISSKKSDGIDKKEQLQVNLNLILKDIPKLRFADQKAIGLLPAIAMSPIQYDNGMSDLFSSSELISPSRSSKIHFGLRAAYAYNYNMKTNNQEYGFSLMKNQGKLSYGLGAHMGYNHNFSHNSNIDSFQPEGTTGVGVDNETNPTNLFEDIAASTSLEVSNTQTYSTGWYIGASANLSYNLIHGLNWHISSGINRHLFKNSQSDNNDPLTVAEIPQQTRDTNLGSLSSTFRSRWEPFLRTSISYNFGALAINFGTQRGLGPIASINGNEYLNHNVFAELNYKF